ncbi:MAG: branched-chain amino acid ABC transporter permease [Spirochaetales bacterium]
MNEFLQAITIGIPQGALYGLMGFGIAMIFRSAGTLNFSHGYSAMVSVLITLTAIEWFLGAGLFEGREALFAAVPVGLVSGAVFGVLIDVLLMRRVKHVSPASMLMITLGLLLVFEGAANLIWSPDYESFPRILPGVPFVFQGTGALEGIRVVFRRNDLAVLLIALVISLSMAALMKYTKIGLAIRARGQDPVGAQAVGINTNRVDSIVWALAIVLAVVVGILVAPITRVHPTMLMNTQLLGITAAVLGGFSSLFGAIWGGLMIGVLERVVDIFPALDGYETAIIFFLIIVVLVFKPEGIFAPKQGRKA